MGQFTKRMSRNASQPTETFKIPEDQLSMEWKRGNRARIFTIRKLFGDEVDWTEGMVLRAVAKVGGRKLSGSEMTAWWHDIGPKARCSVRLCFQAVHQETPDE